MNKTYFLQEQFNQGIKQFLVINTAGRVIAACYTKRDAETIQDLLEFDSRKRFLYASENHPRYQEWVDEVAQKYTVRGLSEWLVAKAEEEEELQDQ